MATTATKKPTATATSTPTQQQQTLPMPPWLQVNLNQYKMQQATMKDLQEKYGFDYSPEYANRIAESEAQAKRALYQSQLDTLDANLRNYQQQLDQNYFLKYMNQAQNQVNRGLNSGVAADQNVRLAMNKQNDLLQYQQKDLAARSPIMAQMRALQDQQMTRAQSLYQDRLQQAFQNKMALDQQNLSYLQFLASQDQFNRSNAFDWYKFNNLSADQAANYSLGERQLQEQIRQFNTEQEWRQYTYAHMSAAEKAQFDLDRAKFGEEFAWEQYKTQQAWKIDSFNNIYGSNATDAEKDKYWNKFNSTFFLTGQGR